MRDDRLPVPIADLVPRERVDAYGTNFSAMTADDLDAITVRGEQLTRSLINAYTPDIG